MIFCSKFQRELKSLWMQLEYIVMYQHLLQAASALPGSIKLGNSWKNASCRIKGLFSKPEFRTLLVKNSFIHWMRKGQFISLWPSPSMMRNLFTLALAWHSLYKISEWWEGMILSSLPWRNRVGHLTCFTVSWVFHLVETAIAPKQPAIFCATDFKHL